MERRKPDSHVEDSDRISRAVRVRRLELIPTDWYWLDALSTADLGSGFIGAVEERAQNQERPELDGLFD